MEDSGTQLIKLGKEDAQTFVKLILLFNEVFETGKTTVPAESYLKALLQKPGFIVLVVKHKNEIAGGLTAFELPMYDAERSEIFIYDVGIKKEFQRQGFGKKLIEELKNYCKESGIKEFFVPAHEEDEHALDFYKSCGGKGEKVVHFNFLMD
ncbi:MAG: GNAT family N-acetyltransferase [Bacteroidia bacterium]|nr:GNAT family N-acetyltransferase [Bacteroidia bacterium]